MHFESVFVLHDFLELIKYLIYCQCKIVDIIQSQQCVVCGFMNIYTLVMLVQCFMVHTPCKFNVNMVGAEIEESGICQKHVCLKNPNLNLKDG